MKISMCKTTCDRGFHICCKECWVIDCDEMCDYIFDNICPLMKEMEE